MDDFTNPEQGMIGRSLRFNTRNHKGKLGMVSIIIDAIISCSLTISIKLIFLVVNPTINFFNVLSNSAYETLIEEQKIIRYNIEK